MTANQIITHHEKKNSESHKGLCHLKRFPAGPTLGYPAEVCTPGPPSRRTNFRPLGDSPSWYILSANNLEIFIWYLHQHITVGTASPVHILMSRTRAIRSWNILTFLLSFPPTLSFFNILHHRSIKKTWIFLYRAVLMTNCDWYRPYIVPICYFPDGPDHF